MSEPEKKAEEAKPAKKGGLVPLIIVGALAVGGGVGAPIVMGKLAGSDEQEAHPEPQITKISGIEIPEPGRKVSYIDFDEIVVNLNEPRFNRYLKISFSLQVATTQKSAIEKLILAKKVILKNWLIGHLADKSADDVRAKFGHNRLRREIHDAFNMILFDDGIERVQDVLFKELNIQ